MVSRPSLSKQLNVMNRERRAAKQASQATKQKQVARKGPAPSPKFTMDMAARNYARLLTDPCNAPLCDSIYPGTGGGIVSRLEADFILNPVALSTGGILIWTPGLGLVYTNSTNLVADTTNTFMAPLFTTSGVTPPGFNFLSTTAQSFRCVAACAQVSYPGSESGRGGIVSMGVVDSGTAASFLPVANGGENTLTNTATMRQLSQHSERTPAAMAEVVWFPGEQDGRFFSYGTIAATLPANPSSNVDHEGRNSIILGFAGVPVATGIRIRLVMVCEWNPASAQGLVATVQPKYSVASVVEVLFKLAKANSSWFIHASRALGMTMGNGITNKAASMMRIEL